MVKRRGSAPAQQTITRRSVLEWLGSGAVLALSSPLLKACGAEGDVLPQGPALPRAEPVQVDVGAAAGFSFNPGDGDQGIAFAWPERTIDRQDVEQILSSWQLQVGGMVERAGVWSFGELLELARQDQVTDFHCVEGWSVYDVPWNGLHLSTLLDLVGPSDGATHITFHTIGGDYNESLPLEVALEPRTMLAYGIEDHTLPLKTGFPLRIVIPRLLAYKNAKYVERIELTDQPVSGFWVARGYSYDGEVPEARLRPGKY